MEAGGWLEAGVSHSWSVSGFLWLVLCCKQGQKLGKLSLTNQGLASLGHMHTSYCLASWIVTRAQLPTSLTHSKLAPRVLLQIGDGFPGCLVQVVGQGSIVMHGLATVCLSLQCLIILSKGKGNTRLGALGQDKSGGLNLALSG